MNVHNWGAAKADTERMSLGKVLGGALKSVETKVTEVEKTVEKKVGELAKSEVVKNTTDFIRATTDSFKQAVSGAPSPANPAVLKRDQATLHYQKSSGHLFDTIESSDVHQGKAGDCYYLSALASVAETHPELIRNAIKQNADGSYTVSLHVPPGYEAMKALGPTGLLIEAVGSNLAHRLGIEPKDRVVQVTVDGTMPTNADGSTNYVHASPTNEIWPQVMEKAFAKLWGSFDAISNGGLPPSALYALTGKTAETHSLTTGPNMLGFKLQPTKLDPAKLDATFATIKAAAAAKKPMEACTYDSDNTNEGLKGILSGHVYSLFGTAEHDGKRFVVLRNPWSHFEPGNDGKDDGRFELPLEDFARQFMNYSVGDV